MLYPTQPSIPLSFGHCAPSSYDDDTAFLEQFQEFINLEYIDLGLKATDGTGLNPNSSTWGLWSDVCVDNYSGIISDWEQLLSESTWTDTICSKQTLLTFPVATNLESQLRNKTL